MIKLNKLMSLINIQSMYIILCEIDFFLDTYISNNRGTARRRFWMHWCHRQVVSRTDCSNIHLYLFTFLSLFLTMLVTPLLWIAKAFTTCSIIVVLYLITSIIYIWTSKWDNTKKITNLPNEVCTIYIASLLASFANIFTFSFNSKHKCDVFPQGLNESSIYFYCKQNMWFCLLELPWQEAGEFKEEKQDSAQ